NLFPTSPPPFQGEGQGEGTPIKLATLKTTSRDGQLIVVSRDLTRAAAVPQIAPTLQAALDDWKTTAPKLREVAARLDTGAVADAFAFDQTRVAAPLPRTHHWADGS